LYALNELDGVEVRCVGEKIARIVSVGVLQDNLRADKDQALEEKFVLVVVE